MPKTKQVSTRNRRKELMPTLGLVGVSLSLASGASAAGVVGPVSDLPFKDTATGPGITLSEEEISDVSLGTFYVFDKENARTSRLGEQVARGCGRGGGGCRGCRGGGGCGRGCGGGGGCGGCGGCGCCLSWGSCRIC
jgi:hypothetical protein